MMAVHFVGFRDGFEYQDAVRVFGQPDFIHKWHDHRMYGDVDDENDTIIFARAADPDKIIPFSWQDHEEN